MQVLARVLKVVVLLAAISIALTGVATLFVAGALWLTKLLDVQHALGMDTQTTKAYASVSGTLPMVVTTLGFSGLLVTAWHHLNCHQDGCPRPGRFPVVGGKYKVCRRHRDEIVGATGLSGDDLRAEHAKHEANCA